MKDVSEILLPDTDADILGSITVPDSATIGDLIGVVDDGAGGKKLDPVPLADVVGDYIPLDEKGAPLGVAELDADGKLPISQLPALAINTITPVASEAAMLALDAQRGDMAIRTDESNQWYVLAADDPTDVGNWLPIEVDMVAGGGAVRTTTTIAVGVVAGDGQATGSAAVAKGAVAFWLRETGDRPCRVRLYGTEEARDADVARPDDESAVSGSYPAGTGCALDVILDADTLYLIQLDPKVVIGSPANPPVTTVYYTIDNYTNFALSLNIEIGHTPFET